MISVVFLSPHPVVFGSGHLALFMFSLEYFQSLQTCLPVVVVVVVTDTLELTYVVEAAQE